MGWSEASKVDEEAMEGVGGMGIGREKEVFPQNEQRRELGPPCVQVCSLPSSLGLPAKNPSCR